MLEGREGGVAVPRVIPITSYTVYYATCSNGFNEWRSNIIIRTADTSTNCDIRFVDDPAAVPTEWEYVKDPGWSKVYLPAGEFPRLLELMRTEKPLSLVLYPDSKRAIVQTGPEPPGEEEPA
jgi:hypothetical protein